MAGKKIILDVKELPDSLKKALRAIQFRRKNIEVGEATSIAPPWGGTGRRGVVAIVNLQTGRHKVMYGSWGGPSAFESSNPLNSSQPIPVPPNGAVIYGNESGGRKVWVDIAVNPQNMADILPAREDVELTEDEMDVLHVINRYNSKGRKRFFEDHRLGTYSAAHPIIVSLAEKGLVKVRGKSVLKTTKGENATLGKTMRRIGAQRSFQAKLIRREMMRRKRATSSDVLRVIRPIQNVGLDRMMWEARTGIASLDVESKRTALRELIVLLKVINEDTGEYLASFQDLLQQLPAESVETPSTVSRNVLENWVKKLNQKFGTNLSIEKLGRKYTRIISMRPGNRNVFAFVRMRTDDQGRAGDILKPASWKGPAKGARGNIFDDPFKGVTKYGPEYFR